MTDKKGHSEPTGYDKYVNYKTFLIAIGAFVALLLIPLPKSMLDVGVEYSAGEQRVLDHYAEVFFGHPHGKVAQWQAVSARILEANMMQGVLAKDGVLKRDHQAVEKMGIACSREHFQQFQEFVESQDSGAFREVMVQAHSLRHDDLTYDGLTKAEQVKADQAAQTIQICLAMVAFVVICFLTEAIPLPAVAFCIGLILVFSGIVTRQEVAAMFWSDAVWFIMGSLMFAAAFVKTGVDKRICLVLFRHMARPNVRWISAIMILVIAPAASFISDHALAAMFLPIGMILYTNSLSAKVPVDHDLAKMLMITIAMACNIGGFGSPSGGARNVIMMTYMEDMFGITIGYGQWIIYGFPFVLIMMPVLWVLVNLLFKPKITDVGPALETLQKDIAHMGGWNRKQIIAVIIFLLMLFCWITEKNLLLSVTGVRLGIGVVAVAGAVAYLLTGIVNWRDYQEKVDWGVVWLYAGAIIFGKVLFSSGTAYWMARSIVEGLGGIGMDSGYALLGVGTLVTAGLTNLMADGPAAAAVGPVTLTMAALSDPGTVLVPFTGLATACASSFAYLLVIGTPPNAIVYASGLLTAKDYLRVGIPCLIASFIVLMALSLFVWPLIGFSGLAPVK